MVEIKMRTGEFGKISTKVDAKIEGSPMDVFSTILELEHAVVEILQGIEEENGIHVHQAFIENLIDGFNREE